MKTLTLILTILLSVTVALADDPAWDIWTDGYIFSDSDSDGTIDRVEFERHLTVFDEDALRGETVGWTTTVSIYDGETLLETVADHHEVTFGDPVNWSTCGLACEANGPDCYDHGDSCSPFAPSGHNYRCIRSSIAYCIEYPSGGGPGLYVGKICHCDFSKGPIQLDLTTALASGNTVLAEIDPDESQPLEEASNNTVEASIP